MIKYPKNIIFPFYHTISNEHCPHIRNLYPVKSVHQFEKELNFFQKNFSPISLIEIIDHVNNNTQPQSTSFFLSFDDGLSECHSIIAPILKKRNISAAFFINSGFVDNKDLFYRYKVSLILDALRCSKFEVRTSKEELLKLTIHDSSKIDEIAKKLNINFKDFLQNQKPYMNWREIEELSEDGFYIGGHSVNHPYFSQIPFDEQIEQTEESVNLIHEKLNLDYKIFSFPFTDQGVTKSYFEKTFQEKICDITFGTAGIKKDEYSQNLQRIPMDNCLGSPENFIRKEMISYHLKCLIGKQKVIHPK